MGYFRVPTFDFPRSLSMSDILEKRVNLLQRSYAAELETVAN